MNARARTGRVLVLSLESFLYQSTNPLDLAEALAEDVGEVVVAAPFADEALKGNAGRGFRCLRLDCRRNASFWWQSLEVARDLRPDVVVGVNSVGFLAADLARASGYARGLVGYQLELSTPEELPRSLSVRWFATRAARADLVIVTGDDRASDMERRYGLPIRPQVVANAPVRAPRRPTDDLRRRARDAGLRASRILVYAGGHGSLCRLATAAEASRLWKSDVGLVLLAFGGTPAERAEVDAAVAASNGRAVQLPPVGGGREKLLELLAGADAGLVLYDHRATSSANVRYATPNKLYDYVACGLPVVASDTPGSLQEVEALGYGASCDPRTPEAIAAAVDRVFADREALAARAREQFANRYRYGVQSAECRRVIAGLARGSGP